MVEKATVLPPAEPPEKRGRPKGSKNTKKLRFTPEEIRTNLHIIAKGFCGLFGYEYNYDEQDYDQEAKAIVRLTGKFPAIGYAISLFDPLLIILGLAAKFANLKKKPGGGIGAVMAARAKKPEAAGSGSAAVVKPFAERGGGN